jgi:hypothetical protein
MNTNKPTTAEIRERHINLTIWANAYPDDKPYRIAHDHRGILLGRLAETEAKLEAVKRIHRYDAAGLNYDCSVIMSASPDGKYVVYADIKAIIREQDND